MACTIGAKVLKPGSEFVLFKNKDLPRESFRDELVVEPDLFGVRGLHIPAGEAGGEDVLSGFSIGANVRGVCACNSHVRSLESGENYDLLTEAALRGTASVREACQAVLALAPSARYNWSNLLIADPREVALIEIADDVAYLADLPMAARANEHLLAHDDFGPADPGARGRLARARLGVAREVGEIMALCRSHEREAEGANLCAHGGAGARNTVYSYLMHWREGDLTLLVARGHPCQADYVRIPLRYPLRAEEVQRLYPTG